MQLIRLYYKTNEKEFAEMDRFFLVSGKVLENLKPMYEKFLPTIRASIKECFKKTAGHTKWKNLSAKYLASTKKMKSKYPLTILKLTGKMFLAATKKGSYGNICNITNDGFVWGINLREIPYARLHDKGGIISGAVSGRMPQREFMILTKKRITTIMKSAHKFIRKEMKAGSIKLD
jgi:phage gpG-like protein